MDLRHLRCFVAVAEELHFSRAAERLHMSQPPLSLAIKELEAELGVRLLERTSRRIALTAQGVDALHDARAVLAAADTLRKRAREAALGVTGTLALGFISLPVYGFLPSLLRRFTTECPHAAIALHEGTTDCVMRDVESGAMDAGLVLRAADAPPTLAMRTVVSEPLVAVLPAEHRLADRDAIILEDLADEPFLGFERKLGTALYDAVVGACTRHGFSPRFFHARQMHTIVSLVSGGIGVALVPRCVQTLHREGVVFKPVANDDARVETVVVWRRDDRSEVLAAFLRLLP